MKIIAVRKTSYFEDIEVECDSLEEGINKLAHEPDTYPENSYDQSVTFELDELFILTEK